MTVSKVKTKYLCYLNIIGALLIFLFTGNLTQLSCCFKTCNRSPKCCFKWVTCFFPVRRSVQTSLLMHTADDKTCLSSSATKQVQFKVCLSTRCNCQLIATVIVNPVILIYIRPYFHAHWSSKCLHLMIMFIFVHICDECSDLYIGKAKQPFLTYCAVKKYFPFLISDFLLFFVHICHNYMFQIIRQM